MPYFYITKAFVRDEIDVEILPQLLQLGDLGIQYCLKTQKAFTAICEELTGLIPVDYKEINSHYSLRDSSAREAMYQLIQRRIKLKKYLAR